MIPKAVRIFVSLEPQDMRRGFDRLARVIREVTGRAWLTSRASPGLSSTDWSSVEVTLLP